MKIASYRFGLILLGLLPLLAGCEFYETPGIGPSAPEPVLLDFSFPSAVGNQWEYSTTTDLNFGSHRVLAQVNSHLSVDRLQTLPGGIVARVLTKQDVYANGVQDFNETYYQETASGLWEVGYTLGNHRVLLKQGQPQPKYRVGSRWFGSLAELQTVLRGPATAPATKTDAGSWVLHAEPQLTLAYGSRRGDAWGFGAYANGNVACLKTVVGTEWVAGPGGSVKCVKLHLSYDLDNDGLWDPNIKAFQYYSPMGLVRATYFAWGVAEVDPLTGRAAIADYSETTQLLQATF